MVQCPVGNRCPQCAGRFTSHVLDVKTPVAVRTFLASLVVGLGFGLCHGFMGGGILGWIVTFVVGVLVGRGLHKIASHKMGKKIVSTVIAGLVVGALIPLGGMAAMIAGMGANQASAMAVLGLSGYQQPDSESDSDPESASDSDSGADAAKPAPSSVTPSKPGTKQSWQEFAASQGAELTKGQKRCLIKVPVTSGDVTENLWIAVKSTDGNDIAGTVVSNPQALAELHPGQPIKVGSDQVLEWKMIKPVQVLPKAPNQIGATRAALGIFAVSSMVSMLISFAIFSTGVLAPFLGWQPSGRLPFSRY